MPSHGGYPQQSGYAPYPVPSPGYAQAAVPQRMPGTLLTVRILMFVGATAGLSLAAAVGLFVAAADPVFALLAGGVFGLYGVGSLALAILAKRRAKAVRWSILAFHILALLYLGFTYSAAPTPPPGEPDPGSSIRSLGNLFTLTNIILISIPPTGRYYRKPSEQAATAPGAYGPSRPPGGHPPHHQPPTPPPGGQGTR
ncbi:hypothetical protein KIK06_12560 [Nocardiopsis sp. EMB25]|uniref:hypothetical protein n=1 Tax=Nocardiopsis sp. EMB25 TaxID=2835867 RepID=UPI0022837942|nr:hypothetical protein [Nocardiopsis sp. EMB25]MCY9784723.1 hypothetical protein [Nocardiopsis sp. EMB25]